ncbi:LLM class flavin-dependent oxidoreductase [Chitinophaga parva]|uniref:Luciferase-like monooxygenase n=1 Tax=Chitinophaga parva TaxID=2169414 RepID=A0A2T7BDT5_9BACT|nr:LLM class flavin-dependent oxidoreductase [Chitinophaga parva]PUZ23253.1 LLM class flavin-dependent oxidoreductase [Chitinophaga parva]
MTKEKIRLSVLDQSPIRKGGTASQALQETVQLAQFTESLGYTRFWVSEHHNTASLAGSTPEVLMAHLASKTDRIRIGSGGVMLPNHSALRVAENFRMLEALFPGRIDLGIGRAPGTDRITAAVLNPSNQFRENEFIEQLSDLQHYFHDTYEPGTLHERVKATPQAATVPQQWLLSSSGQSAVFAAHFGMGFTFAHFISAAGGPEAVRIYRERFRPSADLKAPAASAAFFVFTNESQELVDQQQAIMDYAMLQIEKGKSQPFPAFEDIRDVEYSDMEIERLRFNRARMLTGTPKRLEEKLREQAERYAVDELILVTITNDFRQRLKSYELMAKAFDL